MEKVIDRITTGENNRRVIEDINLLLSEFFNRYRFYLNERPEINFQVKFFSQLQVWGISVSRSFLGNQDTLHFSHPVSSNFTHHVNKFRLVIKYLNRNKKGY